MTSFTLTKENGSTLLEAMIAIAILTIGILTVMTMQIMAIGSSASAMNRTEANNIALSFLETMKELPFDNPNLVSTGPGSGTLLNDANARTFTAASLPLELQNLILIPAGSPAGTIVDRSGIIYRLSWAVQDRILATGEILNKTIRIFMTWNTSLGQNRLEMTTIKYNNVSL